MIIVASSCHLYYSPTLMIHGQTQIKFTKKPLSHFNIGTRSTDFSVPYMIGVMKSKLLSVLNFQRLGVCYWAVSCVCFF